MNLDRVSFMALFGSNPLVIYGTEEDVQRANCEETIVFAITTEV